MSCQKSTEIRIENSSTW